MTPASRKYAEIVAVTLIAATIFAFTLTWLIGQYYSENGLSGPEVTLLITGALGLLNQLGILRIGSQAKDIHREVNGKQTREFYKLESKIEELMSTIERSNAEDERDNRSERG